MTVNIASGQPTPTDTRDFRAFFDRMKAEIHAFYQEEEPADGYGFVDKVLIAFFAGGHVLLEGIPGLGKTELVKTLVRVLGWTDAAQAAYNRSPNATATYAGYRRVQFTPDLMPLDIIGGEDIQADPQTGRIRRAFRHGPLFTHILLADEINRASPKTQSALLQGMAELETTYGNDVMRLGVIRDANHAVIGSERKEDRLFFVIATQNPIEQQGTYPLPEAQLDRFFFKLISPLPGLTQMTDILGLTTTDTPPAVQPVEDAPPHRIAQKVVAFRHRIRAVPVDEKALEKISLLAALTWPDRPDVAMARRLRKDWDRYYERNKRRLKIEETEAFRALVKRYVQIGIGPRGAQTLLLGLKVLAARQGRPVVDNAFVVEESQHLLKESWRHRLLLNYQAENEGVTADDLLDQIDPIIPIH